MATTLPLTCPDLSRVAQGFFVQADPTPLERWIENTST